MKALLFGLFLVISSASAMVLPVGSSTSLKYDGTVNSESIEKHFINIKNTGSALLAGQIVSLDLSAKDGASAAATSTVKAAPLCIVINACAANALCKCQKYGLVKAALLDVGQGASVSGAPMFMSTGNAGYVSSRAAPVASEYPAGIFYDASAVSGSVQVFINL